jgi:ketosteroid isomerase-like protein
MSYRRIVLTLLLAVPLLPASRTLAQTLTPTPLSAGAQSTPANPADPLAPQRPGLSPTLTPVPMPALSAGQLELVKLEGEFSDAVAKGGGPAFASWFAEDGVTLQNGKPPVRGRAAIAAGATWNPKDYQLTWYAEGAQMGPSNDSGFTWGHYDATTFDAGGHPKTIAGRYITFWKKVAGQWKVALDASADEAPIGAECCVVPKP